MINPSHRLSPEGARQALQQQRLYSLGQRRMAIESRHMFFVIPRRKGLPKSVRDQVFERDGQVCTYCGCTEGPFHIDHIQPVSEGGTDDLENLCVACAPCNLSKGALSLEDWRPEE